MPRSGAWETGHDDSCVVGKWRKETFGDRNHRLHIRVGDDFQNSVALPGKQLYPLTKAAQGLWAPPVCGCHLMQRKKTCGRKRGVCKPALDICRTSQVLGRRRLVKGSQEQQLGSRVKHQRTLWLLHNSSPFPSHLHTPTTVEF